VGVILKHFPLYTSRFNKFFKHCFPFARGQIPHYSSPILLAGTAEFVHALVTSRLGRVFCINFALMRAISHVHLILDLIGVITLSKEYKL
jgi:hypothetical protein